jgi:acyl transferase domain-containing protein/acyl carrier protein
MSGNETNGRGDELAIIGMSCRFPGAENPERFWEKLRDGVELVSAFTDEELLAEGVGPELLSHPDFVKAGGFMEGIELFDASFFGYTPREAELLDPQQRHFLECSWEALENAGYEPGGAHGLVGVFAGASISNYFLQNLITHPELLDAVGNFQVGMLNDKDYLATRVSYKLNLKGPSMSVQTACSTSLVAVHMACQSVLGGECDMALAGGVSISILRKLGYLYTEGGISSPDGHCRAFDAKGQGIVGGNGVGVVVVKRLEDALADGDNVLAVVKGTAVNNDGSVKIGYTAPSIEGQAEVIAQAQSVAGVEADSVTYVEAHGTGTALGDPVEVAALTKCFRASTGEKNFCAIGSVKTNLGHTDAAAGVAGVIKTVLSLRHGMLPPSLHFETPNPRIDFADSPFYVNSKLSEWRANGRPRRAGVSSFGIGGTNAHAVLEEAPAVEPSPEGRPWQLLVLSAKTQTALEAAGRNLAAHLRAHAGLNLADVAFTLRVGRKTFEHRRALVCRDSADAVALLERPDPRRVATGSQESQSRPLVFMFTGQGSQYPQMGAGLYEHEPSFRAHVDRCAELLKALTGLDVRDFIYPAACDEVEAAEALRQTSLTQPALFVVEYALARLLMEWGMKPAAMIGHSVGEYVAACLAGVFSLEDALALVAERGRMMQSMPAGSMLSVGIGEEELTEFLRPGLDLAAVNAPSRCVVAGTAEAVEDLQRRLGERGHECARLHTSHAFHSEMMRPVLAPFAARVGRVELHAPRVPFVSNVTGTWITGAEATDPSYWAAHLAGTVRFAEGVRTLKESGAVLLEVGPGQTLGTLARQQLQGVERQSALSTMRAPRETRDDLEFLLSAVGRLWLAGVKVDWKGFHATESRRRVPLPTYPFERERYWTGPREAQPVTAARRPSRGKSPDIADWFYTPLWKQTPPNATRAAGVRAAGASRWLVFADERGLGSCVVERLKAAGHEVVSVRAGAEYARPGESDFVINPLEPGDYESLLKESGEGFPARLLHLWNVGPPAGESDIESFEAAQGLGLNSLIFIAQALAKRGHNGPVQMSVVTSGAQDVSGEGPSAPERATLLGACAVIPQEYPNINCRGIDVEPHARASKLAAQLIDEAESESRGAVVAYRGSRRWVQVFEPVRLGAPEADAPEEAGARRESCARLKERGVYLIAEGAGRVSLLLAEHLARAVRARLVFVSREALPERGAWESWLAAHGDASESGARLKRLLELEASGAEVLTLCADVTSREQMAGALARARERFGRLDGVIYAAAVDGEEPRLSVQEIGREESSRRLRAAVGGLPVLAELLREERPDFCVLMSSLSAVLGGLGLLSAAAAGAYVNAFAAAQSNAQDVPWVSLNWDAWLFPEERGGAADLRGLTEFGISPEEGSEAFRRVMAHAPFSPVVVSTGDLSERLARWVNLESVRGRGESGKGAAPSLHPRPELPVPYVAPRDETESDVAQIWQTLLGIEPVGVQDNLFDLGGDSLLAVQITSRVREALRVEVAVRAVFENPTIAGLVESIEQSRRDADADSERLAEVLDMVEELSEEELLAMLSEHESETSGV